MVLPAFASALLLILSYPPLHLLLPPFVALVPFAVAVDGLPAGGDGPRRAFRGGALLGGVTWGVLLYWIVVALVETPGWALPAWTAAVAALALLTGAVGWALHRMRHRAGVPLWLALPLAWTAGEWLRGHLPGSLAFPWLGLAASLTGWPEFLGIAELVGERGVTFWIALVAGLLAEAVGTVRGAGLPGHVRAGAARAGPGAAGAAALPWAVAGLAVAVAGAGWGVWRAGTLPVRDGPRVAVVQPAVAQAVKGDPAEAVAATFSALDRLIPRVAEAGTVSPLDAVVLPEALLPVVLDGPGGAAATRRLAGYAARVGAPLLLGGIGSGAAAAGGPGSERPSAVHNSVFRVDSGGLGPVRYDKRHLVPFIERVPLLPGVRRLERAGQGRGWWTGSYEPGEDWALFPVGSATVGAFVCFESAFSDVARSLRRGGADVLVNVTNDAWYGRESWYGRTAALWQHPAHLVLRAVETRTGVVRAANTGISLFVDPTGRTREETPLLVEAVRVGVVRTTDRVTPFVRYGDVAGAGSALVVAMLLLAGWRRRTAPGDEGEHPAPGGDGRHQAPEDEERPPAPGDEGRHLWGGRG